MSVVRRFSLGSLLALVGATAFGFALQRILPTIAFLWWIGLWVMIVHPRATDPIDRRSDVLRGAIATLLAWLAVFPGVFAAYMIPACWYFAAAKRTTWAAAIFLLAGPTTLLSEHALVDYLRGSAALRKADVWMPPLANIDRTFRFPYDAHPAGIYRDNWARNTYNEMLVRLVRVFGPMPGSYVGPYPTETEAAPVARHGIALAREDLDRGVIVVDGRSTRLDSMTAFHVRQAYDNYAAQVTANLLQLPPAPLRPLRASLWEQRCLMLWIPIDDAGFPKKADEYGVTVLVDREVGRAFAVYYNHTGVSSIWADWRP